MGEEDLVCQLIKGLGGEKKKGLGLFEDKRD